MAGAKKYASTHSRQQGASSAKGSEQCNSSALETCATQELGSQTTDRHSFTCPSLTKDTWLACETRAGVWDTLQSSALLTRLKHCILSKFKH